MSNLEVVQEVYAAFSRQDMQAILAHLSPTSCGASRRTRSIQPRHAPRSRGLPRVGAIGREAEDIEVLELRSFLTSADAVAAMGHMRCRARRTGRSYESDFVHVVTLRDGLITQFQEFFDTYAAGEAFREDGA